MNEQLEKNADKLGITAYRKAKKAARELTDAFGVSDKMLVAISYLFAQMQEVTPLALQKLLYFVQGIYLVLVGTPFFEEDCQAWVHGPVYENVYNLFKNFKYNPIEDDRDVYKRQARRHPGRMGVSVRCEVSWGAFLCVQTKTDLLQ